jgi:hypothetical protein
MHGLWAQVHAYTLYYDEPERLPQQQHADAPFALVLLLWLFLLHAIADSARASRRTLTRFD